MASRPTLNVNDNHIRNFSMQHYMHRYFNEIPTINRHVAEINRKNNKVARLLENKEEFIKDPKDKSVEFVFKSTTDRNDKERFTVKKKVTFGDIIDSILTFILVVIFIIFLGNLAYVCFFENSEDGLNI